MGTVRASRPDELRWNCWQSEEASGCYWRYTRPTRARRCCRCRALSSHDGVDQQVAELRYSVADEVFVLQFGKGFLMEGFRLLDHGNRQGMLICLVHVLLQLGGQLQQFVGVLLEVLLPFFIRDLFHHSFLLGLPFDFCGGTLVLARNGWHSLVLGRAM